MMRLIVFCLALLIIQCRFLHAQPQFELSRNIYRLPYAYNFSFQVTRDHYSHPPPGRYDLRANAFAGDACGVYQIVAAAGGEVMMVVENNDQSCSGCGEFNNYVWIKHANDEWTKYTHFTQNSVAVNVGDIVNAGDFLGTECWVGSTSPAQYRHLHFELRRPNDPANPVIDEAGGFMDAADGAHLIPVFNNFGKHFLEEGDQPANLNTTCTDSEIALIIPFVMSSGGISVHMSSASITTINNVPIIFSSGSNGMFHAGNLITLSPGFTAAAGSYFHARIGSCTPAGN